MANRRRGRRSPPHGRQPGEDPRRQEGARRKQERREDLERQQRQHDEDMGAAREGHRIAKRVGLAGSIIAALGALAAVYGDLKPSSAGRSNVPTPPTFPTHPGPRGLISWSESEVTGCNVTTFVPDPAGHRMLDKPAPADGIIKRTAPGAASVGDDLVEVDIQGTSRRVITLTGVRFKSHRPAPPGRALRSGLRRAVRDGACHQG